MTNQFEFQKLHLSQYLSLHPLKDKKEKYKSGYVSVLNYFLKQFGTNQWSESNFSLFKVYLSASTGILEKKPPKLKYCRYRDVILVDLLFLTSFYGYLNFIGFNTCVLRGHPCIYLCL